MRRNSISKTAAPGRQSIQGIRVLCLTVLLGLWGPAGGSAAAAGSPDAAALVFPGPGGPAGQAASYLFETDAILSLEQAVAAREAGAFVRSEQPILSFGIGSAPVWVHLRIWSGAEQPAPGRLAVETSWLDLLDVYLVRDREVVLQRRYGDHFPFPQRNGNDRGFALQHAFAAGHTDVFLRVDSVDPLVLPIHVETPQQAAERRRAEDYSYGLLYGFLGALLIYNLVLFIGLRSARYLLYSVYVSAFLLLNIAYTGHGFQLLWPQSPAWTQWAQPILLTLYPVCGLYFALNFLEMRAHFPRIHTAVLCLNFLAGLAMLALAVFRLQEAALLLSFSFVTLFAVLMVALGAISIRAGQLVAYYFLAAAVFAMFGAGCTALAVWGTIPLSTWTYRAVDIGMALEAVLLALALSHQFRVAQQERDIARIMARFDPLTQTFNRRAFHDVSMPVWNSAVRYDRPLSLIILDLDDFKRFNDIFGHDCGDAILRSTAVVLKDSIRAQDIVTRWGGEEFIILLPETELDKAVALAERLREKVAASKPIHEDTQVSVTISLGVAQRTGRHESLPDLITSADQYLLKAKQDGRDRVVHAPFEARGAGHLA